MPLGRFLGDHPTITGDRQVAQLPTSKAESPPIQCNRWVRIGKHPDAFAMSTMNEAFNQWAIHRTKEVFGGVRVLGQSSGLPVSSTLAARPRFRFAFHTSPFHNMLLASLVMYPQTSNFTENSYATLKIYSDVTESTLVSTTEFYYGTNPLNTANTVGWQYLKFIDKQVAGLLADTDYYAVISDVNYGLVQSASVAELNSLTQKNGGYLPQNITSETIITDEMRANLVENIPLLWKRGGAKLLNWTVDTQASPQTTISVIHRNIIDNSSTAITATTPGMVLNMTGKARLSQSSGVPCVMKVYGWMTAGSSNGTVRLYDSSGAIVASIVSGWTTTPSWQSVTFNLPATTGKYDIHFVNNVGFSTFNVSAISIYQYET